MVNCTTDWMSVQNPFQIHFVVLEDGLSSPLANQGLENATIAGAYSSCILGLGEREIKKK